MLLEETRACINRTYVLYFGSKLFMCLFATTSVRRLIFFVVNFGLSVGLKGNTW